MEYRALPTSKTYEAEVTKEIREMSDTGTIAQVLLRRVRKFIGALVLNDDYLTERMEATVKEVKR